MAKNIFDASKTYRCRLYTLTLEGQPSVTGNLAADTVEVIDPVFGKQEFAVFTTTSTPDGAFPPVWVGTYRLPMDAKDRWFGGEVE